MGDRREVPLFLEPPIAQRDSSDKYQKASRLSPWFPWFPWFHPPSSLLRMRHPFRWVTRPEFSLPLNRNLVSQESARRVQRSILETKALCSGPSRNSLVYLRNPSNRIYSFPSIRN